MILNKLKKKKIDKGVGQGSVWVKTKTNVNITKNFLIELQRPIVVKVELSCYIKELYRVKT